MRSVPRIRALLMDADGVTQYPRAGWVGEMARLGGRQFVREALAQEKTTLTGEVDLRSLVVELLDRHQSDCSVDQVMEVWYRIDLDPLTLAMVDRIRAAGVITVLATNQQCYRGGYIRQNLPYDQHFDHQFHSFEVGLAKPDPAYFTHIIDALGIEASEAVFVDDVAANVEGARLAGLRAVRYASTDTHGHLRARLFELGMPGIVRG